VTLRSATIKAVFVAEVIDFALPATIKAVFVAESLSFSLPSTFKVVFVAEPESYSYIFGKSDSIIATSSFNIR